MNGQLVKEVSTVAQVEVGGMDHEPFDLFCKAGHQLLFTYTGSLATSKKCLQVPENRRFVRCKKNAVGFRDALPPLVGVYAKPVLSSESNVDGSENAVELCKVFVKGMKALASKITVGCRSRPPDLVPMQIFPVLITHFLGSLCKDATLFESCWHIPLLQCPDK